MIWKIQVIPEKSANFKLLEENRINLEAWLYQWPGENWRPGKLVLNGFAGRWTDRQTGRRTDNGHIAHRDVLKWTH